MNNADKIRKMTDKELLKFLMNVIDYNCSGCPGQVTCRIDPRWENKEGCEERVLNWLNDEKDYSGVLL